MATIMSREGNEPPGSWRDRRSRASSAISVLRTEPGATCSRTSKKPGKLTSAASAPRSSTPSRDATPTTAPSIASRWSPRGVDHAAAQPRRDAPDAEAVVGRADVSADAPELLDDRLDPVRLLRAELLRPAHDGLAARMARRDGDDRELVDERRHLLGARSSPRRARTSAPRRHPRARRRSAGGCRSRSSPPCARGRRAGRFGAGSARPRAP